MINYDVNKNLIEHLTKTSIEDIIRKRPIFIINRFKNNKNKNNKINITNDKVASKKRVEGYTIINNTLVRYLYDSGSDRTYIDEELFNKIKSDDP